MKHWIARCDTNDAKCKTLETALPTRLLDVRDQEDIRLCETAEESGAYIALSHCWGLPDKTFITTHDTIANMKAGFAIGQAPATFRDAISTTRLLGFRYLWIDSLCIIQDDTADWRREAASMGSVYANASLTIAAANAKDDNDGFLRPRTQMLTSLKLMSSTGNSAQLYLQTFHDRAKVLSRRLDEPLDARGWTLQEQRLSRRSLRFGSTKISWECQCFTWYENEVDCSNDLSFSMELLKPHSTASSPTSYASWYQMVVLFTTRLLTCDSDRLPALLGLATEVAKFDNGTYYAGLWWEDMAFGMLWFRSDAAKLKKPSDYLAPSWSWASLNGRSITYKENDSTGNIILPNAVFRECYVDKSDDTHRANKPGWLDLSAPIIKLIKAEDRRSYSHGGLDTAFRFAHLDVPNFEMNDHPNVYYTRGAFDLAHQDRTEILGLFLMFAHHKTYYLGKKAVEQDSLHWSSLYGILIEYSPKRLPCKRLPFKRVGYFQTWGLEAGKALQILKGAEVQDIRLY